VATNLNIPVPVRGELDTRNPITDRAPGTLVTARDLHPSHWGPRRGSLSFTRAWESPGTALLYDNIQFTQSAATSTFTQTNEKSVKELGTKFTADIWFRLEDTGYAAGKNSIGLWEHSISGCGIGISIFGPNHASTGKVRVEVVTAPTTTTTDTPVVITSTATVPVGTAQTDIVHLRLVRDGASLYLYLNGTLDTSVGTLVATSPIRQREEDTGTLRVARDAFGPATSIEFKGRIYALVLRDGAFRTSPIEAMLPENPWARNIHYYILGRNYDLGSTSDHLFDAGRFGIHPRLWDTGFAVTAANSNSAPANCRVQGMDSWTTRSGRQGTVVVAGGIASFSVNS
jgi:hypothetical protein